MFVCEMCGAKYPKRFTLNYHLKHCKNSESVNCVCSLCKKQLSNPFSLKRHMKMCKVKSQQKALLIGDRTMEDRWGHLMETKCFLPDRKMFSCAVCNFSCDNKQKTLYHIKNCILSKSNLKCKICSDLFPNESSLSEHYMSEHGDFSTVEELSQNESSYNDTGTNTEILHPETVQDQECLLSSENYHLSADMLDFSLDMEPFVEHGDFVNPDLFVASSPIVELPNTPAHASIVPVSRTIFNRTPADQILTIPILRKNQIRPTESLKCELCLFDRHTVFKSHEELKQHEFEVHQIRTPLPRGQTS